jgi:Leucine Rich repeat
MNCLKKAAVIGLILAAAVCVPAVAQDAVATRYYLIGNSLTWDTVPQRLSGDVQWHVDCGVNLAYIQANPDKPCVKESTLWPQALRAKQYDVISVQPHYGSRLTQDVETISAWIKLQPKAVFVIHSGWAKHAQREDEFASYTAPEQMVHSPGYLRALVAELKRLHPGREFRQTMAQNLMAQIAADVAAKQAPIATVEDLYRDEIHVTNEAGKYLMHNAMRHALGQPPSVAGFEKIDPEVQKYLDGILALLETTAADKALLRQILLIDESVGRSALISQISDKNLQSKLVALLPEIEQAAKTRKATLLLEAEIKAIGGKLICTPSGPQWLYLATGDSGAEIFDIPATIDLYNGNNPLKGKGGRNELVTDAWLQKLSGISTLRRIDLANCAIQGEGLKHIAGLRDLRELNLTLTPVNDNALQHLSRLTELRFLGLASTQCTGTGFVHLKELRLLANVNFHFTPLNDAGLQAISQLPISDRLWFAHTHFTDEGAKSLAALTKLKRCGIGSAEKASSGEAVAALVKLPLEDLALLDNQATPTGLAHAAKIVTLRRLDASYAPTVGDDSLKALADMSQLEELIIGGAQLSDDGIQVLATAKILKKLSLSGMKTVTAAGVDRLRQARPELVIELK